MTIARPPQLPSFRDPPGVPVIHPYLIPYLPYHPRLEHRSTRAQLGLLCHVKRDCCFIYILTAVISMHAAVSSFASASVVG